jgi:LCP family protein required for cell wall assembly
LLSAAVLVATGVSWATVDLVEGDLTTADALDSTVVDDGSNASDGGVDILLVGTDSRTDAKGNPLPLNVLRTLRTEYSAGTNTDTIMLVRVPEAGTAAYAVSVPRDTVVTTPGGQQNKINSVYQAQQSDAAQQLRNQGLTDEAVVFRDSTQAGRRALVKTVQDLTGVRIDHYVEVNLLGFALFTEAVEGVEVCLNKAVRDPGSGANFPAGKQTISAVDALSFVRQRNGLPRGDLDRIVRQQVFLAAMVNQMLSAGTLTNPDRVTELVSAARRSIVLDKSWDLLDFAQHMHGIAAGSVRFVTIPVLDATSRDEQAQSTVTVDPAQVRQFVTGLVGAPVPTDPGASDATPQGVGQRHTVDVLNGAGVDGLAKEVVTRLAAAGFTAGDTGDAPTRERSVIKVPPGQDAVGKQVSTLLGGGIPVQIDPTLSGQQIQVLIGRDYQARPGDRLTGPGLLRPEGATSPASQPVQQPPPPVPPITADGVPCIN